MAETPSTPMIVWKCASSFFAALVRVLVLAALVMGCAKALSTLSELASDSGGAKMTSMKQRVISEPSGEVVTSVSGILKLLIPPSTNATTSAQEVVGKSSDVLLLPIERTERSPVVLPYVASLAACIIVICAFIWGIVRVWRDD